MVSPSVTPRTLADQAHASQGKVRRKIRTKARDRAFLFKIKTRDLGGWRKAGSGYYRGGSVDRKPYLVPD